MSWLLFFGAAIILLSAPALIYGNLVGWLVRLLLRSP